MTAQLRRNRTLYSGRNLARVLIAVVVAAAPSSGWAHEYASADLSVDAAPVAIDDGFGIVVPESLDAIDDPAVCGCGSCSGCGDCSACGCCGLCNSACGACRRRFGLILSSDPGFSEFISPISNPVFFEDPRMLTEARIIFLNQRIPGDLGGDTFQLYAMQLRAALTERLSFIATKDGYIVSQSHLLDDGWADVALGFKYALLADPYTQRLLSAGVTYELPVGSTRSLQGNGDGEFHLFLTGGMELAEKWHWISGTGVRLPSDPSAENHVWYWSNHLDREIGDTGFYALAELNWHHWLGAGDGFPLPIEGVDLVNLGSVGVSGDDVVTAAFGFKQQFGRASEFGAAFEFPLTDRRYIFDNRLNVNLNLRY